MSLVLRFYGMSYSPTIIVKDLSIKRFLGNQKTVLQWHFFKEFWHLVPLLLTVYSVKCLLVLYKIQQTIKFLLRFNQIPFDILRFLFTASLLWGLVAWWPCHFILFLESTACISEPCGHLCQGHFGDYSQHDLFSFSGVWVLFVLLKPCFQGAGGLSGCVLSSRVNIHRPIPKNPIQSINSYRGLSKTQFYWQIYKIIFDSHSYSVYLTHMSHTDIQMGDCMSNKSNHAWSVHLLFLIRLSLWSYPTSKTQLT